MNRALLRLVRADLRANRGRVLAATLTVTLATALLLTSRVLSASTDTAISDATSVSYSTADVVMRSEVAASGTQSADSSTGSGGLIDDAAFAAMRKVPGVAAAATYTRARAAVQVGDVTLGTSLESLPSTASFAWQRLTSGRAPVAGTEIALTGTTLDSLRIRVGDQVALGHPGVGRALFRVVGELDVRGSVEHSGAYGVVTEPVARSLAGTSGPNIAMLRATTGTNLEDLIDRLNVAAPVGFAQTTDDLVASATEAQRERASGIAAAASAFGVLALLTAALVLSTTTAVSLTSRHRSVALLRAVGATRRQVGTQVLLEVARIAGAGIAAGLGAGLLLSLAVLPAVGLVPGLPDVPLSAFTVRVGDVLLTIGVAAVLAVLAAVVPTWSAIRVPPADALRQAAPASSRRSVVVASVVASSSLGAGLLLVARGAGAVTIGSGSLLLLVGVMAALVPVLLGLAALMSRRPRGAERRLAAAEITRDPRRAAAEGVALALAAALVTATWVGLASVGATVSQRLSAVDAADLTVGASAGSGVVSDAVVDDLRAVDGVSEAVAVPFGPDVRIAGRDDGRRVTIAIGTAALTTTDLDRALPVGSPLPVVADDTVYLPTAAAPPFPADSRVSLTGADGTVKDLAVAYVDDLDVPSLVSPTLMARVSDSTEIRTVWVRLAPDADRAATIDAVVGQAVLGGQLPVSGPAIVDQRVAQAISAARATATALLAVAVLVAVIGAATTSSSSVAEQWREHAIVRALGLTRRSLRRVVTLRLAIISLASGLIGAIGGGVIGAGLGRLVAVSLDIDPAIRVPWIAIAVLVLLIAAVVQLATTAPVERASLVRPARALTEG